MKWFELKYYYNISDINSSQLLIWLGGTTIDSMHWHLFLKKLNLVLSYVTERNRFLFDEAFKPGTDSSSEFVSTTQLFMTHLYIWTDVRKTWPYPVCFKLVFILLYLHILFFYQNCIWRIDIQRIMFVRFFYPYCLELVASSSCFDIAFPTKLTIR